MGSSPRGRRGEREVSAVVRVRQIGALAKAGSSPRTRWERKKRSGSGTTLGRVNRAQAIEVVVQEVDAVPVLVPEPVRRGGLIRAVAPATQALVLAASGFAAGAAVVGLAARRRGGAARGSAKRRGGARKRGGGRDQTVKIVGTRSLLVDVHLLGGAER
jgi:hypothetical protein